MKYCTMCGDSVNHRIPNGDNRPRYVCNNDACGHIHYENPNIITGCLPTYKEQVLLCKRAIEPRYGYWTLPAGFLENGESTEEGAVRESQEEAQANLKERTLYSVFDLPYINQVYFFYKAELADINFGPGIESLEVRLFDEADIPWQELAFSVVDATLKRYFQDKKQDIYPFKHQVLERQAKR